EAKGEIVRALQRADRLGLCDVLILTRGGGSLEDLWAFNEESVARAIHACRVPVVFAVGHEIDFTIADFVADVRAPTPSAAAEAVSPDGAAWLERFERLEMRLRQSARNHLSQAEGRLGFLDRRLQQLHPAKRLNTQAQRLDELESRLRRAMRQRLDSHDNRLRTQTARLLGHRPDWWLMRLDERQSQLTQRLRTAMRHQLETKRGVLAGTSQELQAISPLATLARGYAIAQQPETGRIVRSYREIQAGDRLVIRLMEGRVVGLVEEVRP
ncbi:exodeoxyribonuclease VII large subunit, partial [Methylomagnum sp.]